MNEIPVFLVHGITDTYRKMRHLTTALQQQDRTTHSIDLYPNNGSGKLEVLAEQLRDYINKLHPGNKPFDLIGFSMGGLVSRYYVQALGGRDRVRKYITISTPHRGTIAALFSGGKGIEQMRPNSEFIAALNRDLSILQSLDYTAIWTPWDLIILPANSSQLGIGQEIEIPVLLHAWMVSDRRVVDRVTTILSQNT
jgi:triacylglycerol lipase